MATLNNVTTEDDYGPKCTLETTYPLQRSTIRVSNKSVARQLLVAKENDPSLANWEEELFVAPGVQPDRRDWYFGVRVRSWIKGEPAQVTIEAVPR